MGQNGDHGGRAAATRQRIPLLRPRTRGPKGQGFNDQGGETMTDRLQTRSAPSDDDLLPCASPALLWLACPCMRYWTTAANSQLPDVVPDMMPDARVSQKSKPPSKRETKLKQLPSGNRAGRTRSGQVTVGGGHHHQAVRWWQCAHMDRTPPPSPTPLPTANESAAETACLGPCGRELLTAPSTTTATCHARSSNSFPGSIIPGDRGNGCPRHTQDLELSRSAKCLQPREGVSTLIFHSVT